MMRQNKKSQKGGFFAVDRRNWECACSCGMNPAVAYLVLARGTGGDNKSTSWSIHAIEKYTGVSRHRARNAIEALIDLGLVTQIKGGTRPKYLLPLWGDQPGNQPPARKPMTSRQKLVFDQVVSGSQPTDKQTSAAYELVNKGWLVKKSTFEPLLEPQEIAPDWIWLPNALVTGAGGETPPIELVRQSQDAMMLRLLVDYYYAQNLRADGGISREVTFQRFERIKVGKSGQFTVWGFRYACAYVSWNDTSIPHRREMLTDEEKASGANPGINFFRRQDRLANLGLIEWVPHLLEGDGSEAEIIHPAGDQNTDAMTDKLGQAAHLAGLSLLTERQKEWALNEGYRLAPVPHHIENVQMVGVARLRYRPHTRLTAAWLADLQGWGEQYVSSYQEMANGQKTAHENLFAIS